MIRTSRTTSINYIAMSAITASDYLTALLLIQLPVFSLESVEIGGANTAPV